MEAAIRRSHAGPRPSRSVVRDVRLDATGLIIVLLALPVVLRRSRTCSDDGNLTRLGNNLIDGLSNGAIWALIALGYTLVYGIIELINFAHGDVFMLGSFIASALYGTFGADLGHRARPAWSSGCSSTLIVAMLVCGVAERDDRARRPTGRCATRRSSRR